MMFPLKRGQQELTIVGTPLFIEGKVKPSIVITFSFNSRQINLAIGGSSLFNGRKLDHAIVANTLTA